MHEKPDARALGSVNVKAVERSAFHEAGHMVVAAALGLSLRTEGLRVDPLGWGIACFRKQPDGSDASRRRIVIATFAGFLAQKRFCPEFPWYRDTDWQEALAMVAEMSTDNVSLTRDELLACAEELVNQHLPAIKALATALLAKDWVPQVRFESGARWSEETTTTEKYMAGEEVVGLLVQYGIPAACGQTT